MQHVRLTQLFPHPDNRPLGINEEKVQQLAEMMKANGYDESKPIKVRPNGAPDTYQIIEGEHRWRAARIAGIETVPVFVKELSDEEALIELVAGNEQTGNHPLDYGRIALKLCVKDSKKGLSIAATAEKWGISEQTLRRAMWAGEVHAALQQSNTGVGLLTEPSVLTEIRKCRPDDWEWFHYLYLSKSLSKADAIEISKRIRAVDAAANHSATVFDLTELKQEVATAKERVYAERLSTIEAIEECAGNLPESATLYDYSAAASKVDQFTYEARRLFLEELSQMKEIDRRRVFDAYRKESDYIRKQTEENALKDQAYYQDAANKKEAEERARAEWESFMPEPGKWYELGRHWLYCGDNRDPQFIGKLPKADMAFADPPYNAGVVDWDENYEWGPEYLDQKADFVLVTPGTNAIHDFMNKTQMRYRWAMYCWIKNGMTKGALGFNNVIFIALFSRLESVFKNMGDHFSITIKTSETEDTGHRGRKPYEMIAYLIEKFSNEGGNVIDPFLGSGTTLLMAERLGRVCYGAEISPEYCKEIMSRFKEL